MMKTPYSSRNLLRGGTPDAVFVDFRLRLSYLILACALTCSVVQDILAEGKSLRHVSHGTHLFVHLM